VNSCVFTIIPAVATAANPEVISLAVWVCTKLALPAKPEVKAVGLIESSAA
jgi:hypothetical protein